jgi:hypothetical protein
VWVAEDTPEGQAWAAFDRLADGCGSVHLDQTRRCRGAWRVAAVPPALGLAIGAVPPEAWVEVEAGTPEFAAWRGRMVEACRAIGPTARLKAPRRVSRLAADGGIVRHEVWSVPSATPPPRSGSFEAARAAE